MYINLYISLVYVIKWNDIFFFKYEKYMNVLNVYKYKVNI